MTQLTDIEKRAKAFADARAEVSSIVTVLNDGIDALKRDNMPALKRCIAKVAERHDNLRALIDANPQLFVKPKTVVMHGVKIGFAKGKGGISFDDPAQVVKLIRKHMPEQADVLIITKESPAKDALAQLSAAELKKIGCHVVNAGEQVVIKPADSEVDKLVDTLIKGATEADAEVEA
jgi:phage host-nuclease inhibitor protein Gam